MRYVDEMTVTRVGAAPADRVWQLLATPACWPAWAPHMAHVTGEDRRTAPGPVAVGQRLRIETVVPGVVVPVRVTDVEEGDSWTMVAELPVGEVRSSHRVVAGAGAGGGEQTAVTVAMRWLGPALPGPVPLGRLLLAPYHPVAALSVRRLLHLAASEAQGADVARHRRCEG